MKVILFVQTGNVRPKCAARGRVEPAIGSPADCWWRATRRMADRWWLVECENADTGRRIIAESVPDEHPACRGLRGDPEPGRILASGGKP